MDIQYFTKLTFDKSLLEKGNPDLEAILGPGPTRSKTNFEFCAYLDRGERFLLYEQMQIIINERIWRMSNRDAQWVTFSIPLSAQEMDDPTTEANFEAKFLCGFATVFGERHKAVKVPVPPG